MLLVLPATAWAGLSWASRTVEFTTKAGDKEAVAVFHFVNSGTTPLTIMSVTPGCGCTTTELAKQTYAPGEAGEIKAVLAIGDRNGLQEKTIQVITDDAPKTSTVLTMRATIPEPITTTPCVLLWRTAEIPTDKSVIITNSSPERIVAVEAVPSAPTGATARIEELEAGARYRIAVQPASIAKPAMHVLPFVIRFADGTTQPLTVQAVVK